jgi:hypothetical protein
VLKKGVMHQNEIIVEDKYYKTANGAADNTQNNRICVT